MDDINNEMVVRTIQDFILQKRSEKHIVNEVIRDDVFAILREECIVLFYPLNDNGVEGCHMIKPVSGEMKQFVFINTTKAVQEQTWTAAHELGHVWQVDIYVTERLDQCELDCESLVNRFAAELLLPEKIFRKVLNHKLDEYNYKGPVMSKNMMVRLVTYLMNYFCTPYKAIIRRFSELGYIAKSAEAKYLDGFKEQSALYERLIKENQYTRLETVNMAYSMGSIEQDINLLEKNEVYSDKKVARLREIFHLSRIDVGEESYDFGE